MVPVQVKRTVVDAQELVKRHEEEKVLLETEMIAVIQFHHGEKQRILREMEEIDLHAPGEQGKSSVITVRPDGLISSTANLTLDLDISSLKYS